MYFAFIEALEAIHSITNEVSRLQLRMLFEYENVTVIASYAHMYNTEMAILYIKGVTCPSLAPPNSGTSTYLSHHSTATSPSMFGTGRRPIPFAGRKASHNGLIARPYTGWMADCSELLLAISPREWKMEELFGGNATTHICDHTPPLVEHK